MSDFSTSLRTNLGVVDINLSQNSKKFIVNDNSNYDLSTEDGHLTADFSDYRRLLVTTQSGASVELSTFGSGDFYIPAPDSLSNTFSLDIFDNDGIYKFELLVLPTWSDSVEYDVDSRHHVYYPATEKIYKVLDSAVIGTAPDIDTDNWEEVEYDVLPAKYRATERVGHICDLVECKEKYITEAVCVLDKHICNDEELCASQDYMNANKLLILEEAVKCAIEAGDWLSAENAIRLSKQICKCKC